MNALIKIAICFILLYEINPVYAADNLGRLFTSKEERKELNYIRKIAPLEEKKQKKEQEEVVKVEQILEPVKQEVLIKDAIRLKGIVYRNDGKNTAWINDSNTFEGDLESQFIKVEKDNIRKDNVRIIMPDNATTVDLKVGDSYEPHE